MKKLFFFLALFLGINISFQTQNLATNYSCGSPKNEIKNSKLVWGVYVSTNLIDVVKAHGCNDAFLVEKNGKQWVQIATFKSENDAKNLADYFGGWYARKTMWGNSDNLISSTSIENETSKKSLPIIHDFTWEDGFELRIHKIVPCDEDFLFACAIVSTNENTDNSIEISYQYRNNNGLWFSKSAYTDRNLKSGRLYQITLFNIRKYSDGLEFESARR